MSTTYEMNHPLMYPYWWRIELQNKPKQLTLLVDLEESLKSFGGISMHTNHR
jgi:hypothetical protein